MKNDALYRSVLEAAREMDNTNERLAELLNEL